MTIQIYLQHQLQTISKKKSYLCIIPKGKTHVIQNNDTL